MKQMFFLLDSESFVKISRWLFCDAFQFSDSFNLEFNDGSYCKVQALFKGRVNV